MELAKLKLLLGITDESKNDLLQFCIDDVTESVLNYCNLEEFPAGLENTGYRMAMELYRNENLGSTTSDNGVLASKSEGDTSASFRVNMAYTESLLKDYQKQLNKYRRLSWT